MVARLPRRRAGRLCRPVVADRDARHELHAARPHPDHHRGQVDRAGRRCGQTWAYKIFSSLICGHPGADLLGDRLRRLLGRSLQPPPLRRAGACGRRQSRQRPADGHRRQARPGARPSSSSASARRCAGVFSTMINFTWWPTSGDGYLLPVLASVFVGGTPTWGGIGTVVGGAIGALTVSFIQTGIVGGRAQRLLRPVLQRPDHHPVAARAPLEPGAVSLSIRRADATERTVVRGIRCARSRMTGRPEQASSRRDVHLDFQ